MVILLLIAITYQIEMQIKNRFDNLFEQTIIDFADMFGRAELAQKTRERRQERQKTHHA